MGERFFLDRKISQSEARNFLPVKYANFVRCAFCVLRSHFFVSLSSSLSPTLEFFSPLFMGLTKAFGCQGVPFGFSTSAYSHFAAVCSQRTAGAVRLIRGRDALTISDIGTISFVTYLSAERSAFPLSHTSNMRYIAFSLGMGPYLYLAFNENERRTHTLLSMRTNTVLTPC